MDEKQALNFEKTHPLDKVSKEPLPTPNFLALAEDAKRGPIVPPDKAKAATAGGEIHENN